MLLISGVVYS